MLEQIRAAVEMASGLVEVPRKRAEKIAKDIAESSEMGVGQVSRLTEEIVKRSRDNAEMVRSLISSEIKRQVKALGLATKDDLDRLGRRIDRIEKSAKPKAAAKKKKSPAAKKKGS